MDSPQWTVDSVMDNKHSIMDLNINKDLLEVTLTIVILVSIITLEHCMYSMRQSCKLTESSLNSPSTGQLIARTSHEKLYCAHDDKSHLLTFL